jgi:pimeloyl-ACP methyl ester carboxylesterase
LPENGKLHEFDFLTSDEYMGRMIWWFAQTVPDVFVYPIVQAMAGEGVEVDMEQWGRGWFQKDGKGYNLTSAWYTSQAGAENSCKKAPQYYEVSKPYWDKGQLEGFPIWIIGGTEDGIIRSDNDVRAKAGHEWQDGARYADPNTGKHYFHRLRDALEPIVGKENVELHWIPGASHLLSKPGGTTLKDVAENKPNYARTGANIVRREISEQQSGN